MSTHVKDRTVIRTILSQLLQQEPKIFDTDPGFLALLQLAHVHHPILNARKQNKEQSVIDANAVRCVQSAIDDRIQSLDLFTTTMNILGIGILSLAPTIRPYLGGLMELVEDPRFPQVLPPFTMVGLSAFFAVVDAQPNREFATRMVSSDPTLLKILVLEFYNVTTRAGDDTQFKNLTDLHNAIMSDNPPVMTKEWQDVVMWVKGPKKVQAKIHVTIHGDHKPDNEPTDRLPPTVPMPNKKEPVPPNKLPHRALIQEQQPRRQIHTPAEALLQIFI